MENKNLTVARKPSGITFWGLNGCMLLAIGAMGIVIFLFFFDVTALAPSGQRVVDADLTRTRLIALLGSVVAGILGCIALYFDNRRRSI